MPKVITVSLSRVYTMIVGVLVLCGVVATLVWWFSDGGKTVVPEESAVQLPPAQTDWSVLPWLSHEPIKPSKRVKPPATIKVVDKPPPELGLGTLPSTSEVTGTALLDAEEAKYNISSIMDMATGDTRIHAVKLPAPVFGKSLHGELGVYYGYKTSVDTPVVRGIIRQDLVRSKDFYAGGLATLDSDGEAYAGVGARYSW